LRNKVQTLEHLHSLSVFVDKREIFLHSYIHESEDDPGIDFRSALQVIKNLRFLDSVNHNPILIHLISTGGSVDDGMAIYDAIKNTQSRVIILVHGYAQSMGVLILQAADYRVMMPNAFLMVHGTAVNVSDNVTAVESLLDFHRIQNRKMLDILLEKCMASKFSKENKMSVKSIEKHIIAIIKEKQEWYLTAENAVHYGLSDAILETPIDEIINV
jgi:ATP-dependent protease ClpP protease subunit